MKLKFPFTKIQQNNANVFQDIARIHPNKRTRCLSISRVLPKFNKQAHHTYFLDKVDSRAKKPNVE